MAFNYIAPAPDGSPKGEQRDRARAMAETQVPRDERRSLMHGGLELSLQTAPGLCKTTSRCILKDGHAAEKCWPV